MILIDQMKNLKIYRTKTFLPTIKGNKKKNSAILLMTPNLDSSKRLMNNEMFVNSRRYESYYLEKDISYYINSKVVEEVEESTIISEQKELELYTETKRSELPDSAFGVPSKRKFPLDTEAHVRSAVKFFNYVDSEDEKELADNLISALEKYDIKDIKVSDKNRFSKYYYNEYLNEADTEVKVCKYCGGTDIKIYFKGEPIYICGECNKYLGTVPFKNESFSYDNNDDIVLSEDLSNNLPTNSLNLGDKVLFFNEAAINDTQLKRILFSSRIKYRKELMLLLDDIKNEIPWIKYAYPNLDRYVGRNLFVDLYYYNAVFFQNNVWTMRKGLNLYLEFMDRLLNHPNIKSAGYNKKTIFIPVNDWNLSHDGMIWNYRKNINPISCIYQLLYEGKLNELKKTFKDIDVVFVGKNCFFKINFSQIEAKDLRKATTKFKLFCIKICNGENFSDEDIDTSADNKESKEVITAKIIDKIENAKGIDLTKKVAVSTNKIVSNTHDNPMKYVTVQNKTVKKVVAKDLEDLDDEVDYNDSQVADVERDKELDKLSDAISDAIDRSNSEDEALDKLDDEEINRILLSLGNDNDVNISASRSSRMSKLNNDALDKELNGRTIRDILEEKPKESEVTNANVSSPNKEEWSKLTYVNLDKNYNLDKDIVNIFRMFADCSRPMVIKDIKATDNSTSEDRVMLYDVTMEDYKGRRFRIKLDIPIMEDNRFLLRGNNKSIQTQLFTMPIIKTNVDRCQITSNYRKVFIDRFAGNSGRSLPATSKLLKAINKYSGSKLKVTNGNNDKVSNKYHLPMDYIDIAGVISKIETSNYVIMLNQDEIRANYTVDDTLGIPFIYNKKINAIEYFSYDTPNTTFIGQLCKVLFKECPELEDLYSKVSRTAASGYSRAYIMGTDIPLVLVCAYHIGLRSTMDRAGIKYETMDKLTSEIRRDTNKDWIEFDDGYLVYDVNYESSLLMSGLKISSCPTELFKLSEMDSRNMYLEFLDNYGGRIKADGLENFYDLFVDPMTKETLEYYHLPTNYIDLLLYGNSMLVDNKFTRHTDTSSRRFRRYQLISVYTYQVLAKAYGEYLTKDKHSSNASFAVKQNAVIDEFLTDNISSDDSVINALRDVETTNSVTTKGPSGMNSDRAYTLDKRAYDDSMVNVLGMSTGFAGNVGVTRQATINADITEDGYVKDQKDREMNDANTLTATETMIPFGSTRDDPMRTAMSFIQTSKHSVRTEDSDPLLVTSGADEAMPYLTTDRFAFKAKEDGTVKILNDRYMIIQYTNGKKDYINLKEEIEKNSDGGYFVPLKLTVAENIKVNTKFKKNQILAYDTYSFSNKLGESNNIAYNVGKIAKVAILNTDEGFEDAGIISASMAKKLATRVNNQFTAVINKDSRLFSIVKVGDHVEASDDLIIWEDAFDDEDTKEVMNSLNSTIEFSDLGKRKLKSEVTGTVTAIKIFRTVETDDLSPSLKKLVNMYEKPLKEEAKILEDNGLSSSKVAAHYKLNPTGKLKRAQDAILVEIYVEFLDTVGVGDKIVYNSANKAVEKAIFPEGLEPYTAFRPNEKIDAFVADSSISKRLVASSYTYGSLQKLMIELDRSVKDIMGLDYDDSTV